MPDAPATTTYFIPEPFEQAVGSLRRVLTDAGLKITGELDISGRLQRRLLIDTPSCLVLFAAPAAPVSALTPLHVVVSAHGSHTEIHVLRIPESQDGLPETSAAAELGQLGARLSRAIGKIGMRAVVPA